MHEAKMTRRAALGCLLPATAALVGMGAASQGCKTAGAKDQRVTLRFWNGWTGPDGARALALVRAFNDHNPDIEVHMQRIDWGTYYNKLFVAGIAGRAPELFVLHTSNLRRFAEAKFIRPIDDLIARGFPVADLDANVWQATHIDGPSYGLPVDIHMVGAYYNKKLLRDAGYNAPPTNRTEFVDVLRKITNGNGSDKIWGCAISAPSQTAFTLMTQFGGQVFTPDLRRCALSSAENAEALQFLVDLIRKDKTISPPEGSDPWVSFRQGRVGITWNGIYMLPDLQKQQDLEFAGAPVAQIGGQNAVWASSHNFCLKANMDPRRDEAAWRFTRFYSDHSLEWAKAGQVPVRESVRRDKEFAALTVQSQFAREIPYTKYQPQVGFAFEFQTEFDFMVERVLRSTATPTEALADAEKTVNKIIARRESELALAAKR